MQGIEEINPHQIIGMISELPVVEENTGKKG